MNASAFSLFAVFALAACSSTGITPAPNADACPGTKAPYFKAAACGASASFECVDAVPTCYQEYCSCENKTIVGCLGASEPFAYAGRCKADAGADASACDPGDYLAYSAPGCNGSVVGVCSAPPPPCAQEFCGCDGKTIIGCGVAPAPYSKHGACTPTN